MRKGILSLIASSSLALLLLPAQAQQGSPFFQDDTPTRFTSPDGSSGQSDSIPDQAPSLMVRAFFYQDFDSLAQVGVSLAAVEAIAEQHRQGRDGLYDVAGLNDLVATLTRYLRAEGLLLARVIVPEQRIENETLALRLVIGRLEAVIPNNNNHYSDEILVSLFRSQIGQPVQQDRLEQSLMRFTDFPGVEVRTALAPGNEPGTTRMQLDVLDETPFNALIQADNYGSADTGPYRLTLSGQYNNPGNRADQLSGQLRFSFFPSNSFSGQFSYRLPLDTLDLGGPERLWQETDVTLGYSASRFAVGGDLAALDIEGSTGHFYLRTDRTLDRSRSSRTNVFASLNLKASRSEQNEARLGDDRLTVLELGVNWNATDDVLGGGFSQVQLSLSQGIGDFLGSMEGNGDERASRQGRSGDYAGGTFRAIRLTGERLQSVGGQYLLARTTVQSSGDLLTSMEQYSFGGAGTVRGFPAGDRIADSVWALSLEYYGLSQAPQLTLPIDQLKVALFWDLARGVLNDARPNEVAKPTAMSLGAYSQFMVARHYQTRLELAVPVGAQPPSDDRSYSIGFSISRRF